MDLWDILALRGSKHNFLGFIDATESEDPWEALGEYENLCEEESLPFIFITRFREAYEVACDTTFGGIKPFIMELESKKAFESETLLIYSGFNTREDAQSIARLLVAESM